VIQAVSLASSVVSKLFDVIAREKTIRGKVKRGLDSIRQEMKLMIHDINLNEEMNQGGTHEIKLVLLKELACDIEDFIDVTWVPGVASGLVFSATGIEPRNDILGTIDGFKERILSVRNWKPGGDGSSHVEDGAGACSCTSAASGHSHSEEATRSSQKEEKEANLWGICKHRELLCELLSEAERQPPALKVISIVGCRGVGKTTLARAVYNHCRASDDYDCVAWVVASECHHRGNLPSKVLKELGSNGICSLQRFLRDKRCLIVIDDVSDPKVWKDIKHEFPEEGPSSRIIVTTSVHSVAAECSWGSYVYTMQCLGKDDSEKVFWEKVGEKNQTPALQRAAQGILTKCGDLPLALISAANYLRKQGQIVLHEAGGITVKHCETAARTLGQKILHQDAEFSDISKALLQCYNKLPNSVHQSCLLYASVFPRGRPINSKVLLRRLMAEGLVVADGCPTDEEDAKGFLDKFIDCCIIEPVEINNDRVVRCKVQSIMLEFIIHKAVSKNFIALVDKDELLSNKGTVLGVRVRRLSVQDSSEEGIGEAVKGIDLSVMRSLTIFGSPLLDLEACKLLRVLDLEGCKGFSNDDVFGVICNLLFLKYLNLRHTDVFNLPSKIRSLKYLETLDIRDTGVHVVPTEVISLPRLAHLFGQFKLAHGIKEEISKKSRLQTLAGVVVTKQGDQSFENIILHAGKLRKVKIYETTSQSSNIRPSYNRRLKLCTYLGRPGGASCSKSPLLQIKERFTGNKALQVLSINSSYFSTEFVNYLQAPCAITSIKLRGKLKGLPDTTTLEQLVNLNKLMLISTGLSGQDLSALQSLACLQYLKLAEEHNGFPAGSFVVKSGGFPSLNRLCLEAPDLPQLEFQPGSMNSLTILDLICPHPDMPEPGSSESRSSVVGLSNLQNLNEVILHYSTMEQKMRAWKEEAIRHKNRPSVKRQPKPIIHAA